MATAPPSIKVLLIPADGGKPRHKTLKTLKEDFKPKTSDASLAKRAVAKWGNSLPVISSHSIMYSNGPPQPKVSLLPDTRKEHWSAEAWKKRAIFGDSKYHIFYTTHVGNGLKSNKSFQDIVSGDAFVVKLSGAKDRDGHLFYEDIEPGISSLDKLPYSLSTITTGLRAEKIDGAIRAAAGVE